MGALGAFLGSSRSFVNYIGNRQFAASWGLFYLLRPLLGAGLALVVFFGTRIGAVGSLGTVASADPFAAAFVAGLVGLFVDSVLGKLQELVVALIPTREPRADPMRSPVSPGTPPRPAVTSATGTVAGGKMTIKGANFTDKSKAFLAGSPRTTTFVSATELTVTLDATKDTAGTVKVKVANSDTEVSPEVDGTIT
jgi:hypothetical protein